ncbi:hypothetical protein YTPLAS18_31350 [Nitrospira sp.]|nr:hypothetical protein YTPLAS18_31350 [Nitrospira sp.]
MSWKLKLTGKQVTAPCTRCVNVTFHRIERGLRTIKPVGLDEQSVDVKTAHQPWYAFDAAWWPIVLRPEELMHVSTDRVVV